MVGEARGFRRAPRHRYVGARIPPGVASKPRDRMLDVGRARVPGYLDAEYVGLKRLTE
jgi:hypothetical protein